MIVQQVSPQQGSFKNQADFAVEASDLTFSYGRFPVLKGVDLNLEYGQTIVLTGENGCGKSTFLKVLIGELPRNGGDLKVLGQKVRAERGLQHVGYVPQANVMARVSFPITAQEIAVQGLARDFGVIKIPKRRHLDHTAEKFHQMGLGKYLTVPFGELSGGLQQRVMITRALLADPKLLVLDEPTAGVDKGSRAEFLALLHKLGSEGLTILIVSHDVDTMRKHLHVSHTYLLEGGKITNDSSAV